jgi:cell division protein FtsI/penicillin-binding protein 2
MEYVGADFRQNSQKKAQNMRLAIMFGVFLVFGITIIVRLFFLMILQRDFYLALASGSQEMYEKLVPERGEIFIQDSRTREEFPVAMNKDYFILFADTRQIESDKTAEEIATKLSPLLGYDDEQKLALYLKLKKENDPYEPIEQKVEQNLAESISTLNLPGIGLIRKSYRYYPEDNLASHVIGFLGKDEQGKDIGRYGVEGYLNSELSGSGGFMEGLRGASGSWISIAGKAFKPAQDGADILLTIDRALQFTACEKLKQGMQEFGASSAALVIMDPFSGAIRAMCSEPGFDLNLYGKVDSVDVYNNTAIFTPYEPGSIFKPLVMAAALNEEVLAKDSIFFDSGSRTGLCAIPIRNAGNKSYGDQSMTGILENSINTGMVYVAERLSKKKLIEYFNSFGFGIQTGLGLDVERTGNFDVLSINSIDKFDCYSATASFGQGVTATPLQMAVAFSAIANGGSLVRPYIVDEIRYSDGKIERTKKQEIRQIISNKTASVLGGMLVNVVDKGHAKQAGVKGYYVAAKTGTAQIPGKGGYTEETNHSLIGFAPADDPKFVMIVKYEKPRRAYAESTAAPIFGQIAKFALQYYAVEPKR